MLGASAAGKDFNFAYSVLLKAGETAKLSVAMQEGEEDDDDDPAGFFKRYGGILVLVIVAGAALYTILSQGEEEASPVKK